MLNPDCYIALLFLFSHQQQNGIRQDGRKDDVEH